MTNPTATAVRAQIPPFPEPTPIAAPVDVDEVAVLLPVAFAEEAGEVTEGLTVLFGGDVITLVEDADVAEKDSTEAEVERVRDGF